MVLGLSDFCITFCINIVSKFKLCVQILKKMANVLERGKSRMSVEKIEKEGKER